MGKVDTTVIFASGKGERMKPLTFDTPKPLLKVKGEILIERQIQQLKEKNITDIYVIVGYLDEKFKYLSDKYNVKLIYNEDFLTKETLCTLQKVIPYIKDKSFYLCNGDVYLTNNIFKNFENETNFKVFYLDKTENVYTDVASNAHIEIAYFDKNYGSKLIKYCEELFSQNNNDNMHWEDIIYTYKNEFGDIKINYGKDIYGFDTVDDIKLFDKDIDTGCKSIECIKKVFNVSEKDIVVNELTTAGLTNYSYVFSINNDAKKYLIRVPGNGTNNLINRKLEAKVLREIVKYDITEKIIYINENTGYKISEYIEDGRVVDTKNEDDLRFAIAKLKELHSIDIDIEGSTNLFDWVLMYENAIKKYNLIVPFHDHDIIKQKIDALCYEIKKMNRKMKFCHGDANPSNMLITNGTIKFIDFEYVNVFDQAFEIAMFALNAGFKYDKIFTLVDYYLNQGSQNDLFDGMTKYEADELVIKYFAISQYYCYLWGIVFQHIKSVDFYDYIISCYNKAKEALHFLEGNKNE